MLITVSDEAPQLPLMVFLSLPPLEASLTSGSGRLPKHARNLLVTLSGQPRGAALSTDLLGRSRRCRCRLDNGWLRFGQDCSGREQRREQSVKNRRQEWRSWLGKWSEVPEGAPRGCSEPAAS